MDTGDLNPGTHFWSDLKNLVTELFSKLWLSFLIYKIGQASFLGQLDQRLYHRESLVQVKDYTVKYLAI